MTGRGLVVAGEERNERRDEPLVDEVRCRQQEPERSEHRVARAPDARAERDVHERGNRDQDPVRVARVPEPEQRAADREAGDDLHPEAVDTVDREANEHREDPEDKRQRRRPVAAVRQDIGDEEPRRSGLEEDEEREPEGPPSDGGPRDERELDQEMVEVKARERRVRVREPAEPLFQRSDQYRQRNNSREREEARGQWTPNGTRAEREDAEDDENEERPADKRCIAVVAPEHRQQRTRCSEDRQSTRVEQERRARP